MNDATIRLATQLLTRKETVNYAGLFAEKKGENVYYTKPSEPSARGTEHLVEALLDYITTGNLAGLAVVLDEERERLDAELNRPLTETDVEAEVEPDDWGQKRIRDTGDEHFLVWGPCSDTGDWAWMPKHSHTSIGGLKTVRDFRDLVRLLRLNVTTPVVPAATPPET